MNNIFVHTFQTKAFLAAGLGLPFLKIVAGKADPIPQVNIFIFFTDLKFVKKFTRPNFRSKEFYTLKTRKSRLFLPAINSKNASLSGIGPSFG